jgi:SAM-dependent methyltransferase
MALLVHLVLPDLCRRPKKPSRTKSGGKPGSALTGSSARFQAPSGDCMALACRIDLIVAIYDVFAPYYDAATGDPSTETAFIDSIIKDADLQPVTLLEVACGTGGIIASLAGSYQVAGLDISPGMLAVARKKLPEGIPLYEADMSSFALNARFDAVICVYNGINHLLRFSDWERFFECAYRHLNDGGVLVFDIFTIDDLKIIAGIPETVQQFGENYLRMRVRASTGSVFDWNIELELQGNGRRELLTEVIRTASFPPEKIREALSERFVDIQIFESDGAVSESGTRIWFACTKPRSTV